MPNSGAKRLMFWHPLFASTVLRTVWHFALLYSQSNFQIYRMCVCVCMYITVIISLDTGNRLVFVMQVRCVFMWCSALGYCQCIEWLCCGVIWQTVSVERVWMEIECWDLWVCDTKTLTAVCFVGSSDCRCCWQHRQLTGTRNCPSCRAVCRIASEAGSECLNICYCVNVVCVCERMLLS
jgi:hypothetical protein